METINQKFDELRGRLLIHCLPSETPTKTQVISLCRGFRLTVWSFLLKSNNKEELKKIDNESKINILLKNNDLLALCSNATWKSLLKKYGRIFPKAIYLEELCN